MRFRFSFFMPKPLSEILILRAFASLRVLTTRWGATSGRLYLRALSRRLLIKLVKCMESAKMIGSSASSWVSSFPPAASTFSWKVDATSATTTSASSSSNLKLAACALSNMESCNTFSTSRRKRFVSSEITL